MRENQTSEPLNGDDLLTIREVAKRLRVDGTTVRRWVKSGVLEAITLPHRGKRQVYRIRCSTLNALLAPSSSREAASSNVNSHSREIGLFR